MGVMQGKVVVVTGAGAGLGRATAHIFAQEGAKVVACDRNESKIKALETELTAHGENLLALVADVSVESDVKALFNKALSQFGRVDILINNAAVFENFLISETSLESWNYQFSNNVTSAFLMTKECLPIMRKQKDGMIVNISSGLAKAGGAGFGPYSASKAAIETLSYSVQEEESQHGIIVNVVNPGVIKSDMQTTGTAPTTVARELMQFVAEENQYAGQVINL